MKLWVKDRGKIYQLTTSRKIKIVYQIDKGLSIFANSYFKKGEKMASLRGSLVKKEAASPFSIQLDKDCFMGAIVDDFVWEDFINHSCNPNIFINVPRRALVVVKDIKKDEEITFNYLTTEYDMKEMGTDFKCFCGDKNCFKNIKGFRYLSKNKKSKLKPFLSPYLLTKM